MEKQNFHYESHFYLWPLAGKDIKIFRGKVSTDRSNYLMPLESFFLSSEIIEIKSVGKSERAYFLKKDNGQTIFSQYFPYPNSDEKRERKDLEGQFEIPKHKHDADSYFFIRFEEHKIFRLASSETNLFALVKQQLKYYVLIIGLDEQGAFTEDNKKIEINLSNRNLTNEKLKFEVHEIDKSEFKIFILDQFNNDLLMGRSRFSSKGIIEMETINTEEKQNITSFSVFKKEDNICIAILDSPVELKETGLLGVTRLIKEPFNLGANIVEPNKSICILEFNDKKKKFIETEKVILEKHQGNYLGMEFFKISSSNLKSGIEKKFDINKLIVYTKDKLWTYDILDKSLNLLLGGGANEITESVNYKEYLNQYKFENMNFLKTFNNQCLFFGYINNNEVNEKSQSKIFGLVCPKTRDLFFKNDSSYLNSKLNDYFEFS